MAWNLPNGLLSLFSFSSLWISYSFIFWAIFWLLSFFITYLVKCILFLFVRVGLGSTRLALGPYTFVNSPIVNRIGTWLWLIIWIWIWILIYQCPRKSEIAYFNKAIIIDQNICWLNISVNNICKVNIIDCGKYIEHDCNYVRFIKGDVLWVLQDLFQVWFHVIQDKEYVFQCWVKNYVFYMSGENVALHFGQLV